MRFDAYIDHSYPVKWGVEHWRHTKMIVVWIGHLVVSLCYSG